MVNFHLIVTIYLHQKEVIVFLLLTILRQRRSFSAETTDGTGIEKDIVVNGLSAKLLGVTEMDVFTIYIENGNWKMIISCFDRASNIEGTSDVKEEEIIKMAESIRW